jgi:hypothetical protein
VDRKFGGQRRVLIDLEDSANLSANKKSDGGFSSRHHQKYLKAFVLIHAWPKIYTSTSFVSCFVLPAPTPTPTPTPTPASFFQCLSLADCLCLPRGPPIHHHEQRVCLQRDDSSTTTTSRRIATAMASFGSTVTAPALGGQRRQQPPGSTAMTTRVGRGSKPDGLRSELSFFLEIDFFMLVHLINSRY